MANHEKSPQEGEEEACLAHLPKAIWCGNRALYCWQGCWLSPPMLKRAMALQAHFKSLRDDIILASQPKAGTTWLKAILYSIVNHNSSVSQKIAADELLSTHNPHQLVPYLEIVASNAPFPDFTEIPSPRIFSTHLPYELLPESIRSSGCRIIYITRNPRDTFVSFWHFVNNYNPEPCPLEEAFDSFCRGISPMGPFFDHALGYWMEKERVHFVMYEEMKEDTREQVKRLAKFLGCSLSLEEIDEIVSKCSFDRLSNLEVNKSSETPPLPAFRYRAFFRRGTVGDWRNYFTDEMIKRLDGIAHEKLEGSGLHFQIEAKEET